ncbi:MAG: 23S rRNA (adenine(2503)-C(2))-methyltransferase RlmN [Candidatus Cloacimonetes bacterium]|nr:23S rRNA (adenine(2503)-C(2))-methyltransferase RlmN [Candidatus Cloacimonadota bacterium]
MLTNVYSLTPSQLAALVSAKFPAYRGKQLVTWLYQHLQNEPDKMSNLPGDFKTYLKENFSFHLPVLDASYASKDGATKYRYKLIDDTIIESVIIPEGRKNTLCISSQVGCSRNCSFCATGKMGLIRNLSSDEIVGQIILANRECAGKASGSAEDESGSHITNLVFMGMGEPFDNLDNVLQSLKIIQDESGLSFSPRRTTVSTCGVVPAIIAFADSGVRAKLAISLNSAIDEKRQKLMPINRKYPISELKQALLYYLRKSKFRVTIEYILMPEINMFREDINALRKFVGDISCKINFIPFNPAPGSEMAAPTSKQIEDFLLLAKSLPQAITLRKSRGADIFGACGQLYRKNTVNSTQINQV